MQNVRSARSAGRKMTNERREEGKGIYLRRWSRMAELTVTVAVLGGAAIAVTVKPSDSGGASSPPCRDTSRCLLPPPVFSFCLVFFLLRVCLSARLLFLLSFSFLPPPLFSPVFFVSVSLSLGRPPLFLPFLLLFSFPFLRSGSIYRGRGSAVDPAPTHHRPCMVRTSPPLPRRRPWWPMEALLMEHGCSGISSWDGWRLTSALKHVGEEKRERKQKSFSSPAARPGEEEEETVPP